MKFHYGGAQETVACAAEDIRTGKLGIRTTAGGGGETHLQSDRGRDGRLRRRAQAGSGPGSAETIGQFWSGEGRERAAGWCGGSRRGTAEAPRRRIQGNTGRNSGFLFSFAGSDSG